MRIVLFVPFRAEGGSLKNLAQLLTAWEKQGQLAQHHIILHAAPESIQRIFAQTGAAVGLHIALIPSGASQGLRRLVYDRFNARKQLQALRPDAIFCPGGTLPAGVTAPIIINYQNLLPLQRQLYAATQNLRLYTSQRILRSMFRRSLAAATVPIFNSRHALTEFEALIGRPLPHARVIPRAMETPRPDHQGAAELIETMSPLTPFVFSAGHIYPYKKYDNLIRGFAEYMRLTGEKMNYLIAGGAGTRGSDTALAALARELGVADRVRLLGSLPYALTLGLIARSRAFLFGSLVENCPNALLEAMALAKPILSSDRSSMPEFAGDTVLYINPEQPSDIAAGLERILHDAPLAEQLGKAAQARVNAMPGVDEMASATMQAVVDAATMRPFPRHTKQGNVP